MAVNQNIVFRQQHNIPFCDGKWAIGMATMPLYSNRRKGEWLSMLATLND